MQVTPDDYIYCAKYRDLDVNDVIVLQRVNLLGSRYETVIGKCAFFPYNMAF